MWNHSAVRFLLEPLQDLMMDLQGKPENLHQRRFLKDSLVILSFPKIFLQPHFCRALPRTTKGSSAGLMRDSKVELSPSENVLHSFLYD